MTATTSQPTRPYRPCSKAQGAVYTPVALADFVAHQMLMALPVSIAGSRLRILDPALGEGQLATSLLGALTSHAPVSVELHGYDTDAHALRRASDHIATHFPATDLKLHHKSFLDFGIDSPTGSGNHDLFTQCGQSPQYDLVIANPPYVRTQVLGSTRARTLARDWGLAGRVDLYYAFLLAIGEVLGANGIAGVIVSNRFMTTKSGASIRKALPSRFDIKRIWDLGDTKLFDAAVLPAVLILGSHTASYGERPPFTSIYETTDDWESDAPDVIEALRHSNVVRTGDGRRFFVQHGVLPSSNEPTDPWRVATPTADLWIRTVKDHTWATLGSVGRVRVGVKTCADKVFIRNDWKTIPFRSRPELLRPLMTHHLARSYRPRTLRSSTEILYPHKVVAGRRCAVDLAEYPRDAAYLEKHREALERRKYVTASGRKWYELWVPQDPDVWPLRKLVWRDIAATPTFWVDLDGMVVNGDCYWWLPNSRDTDLLWLAAGVGNSSFVTQFYDHCFNNRLYAGRRRFMTQYVKTFPLPNPERDISREICRAAKRAYVECDTPEITGLQRTIDGMVLRAFGLTD